MTSLRKMPARNVSLDLPAFWRANIDRLAQIKLRKSPKSNFSAVVHPIKPVFTRYKRKQFSRSPEAEKHSTKEKSKPQRSQVRIKPALQAQRQSTLVHPFDLRSYAEEIKKAIQKPYRYQSESNNTLFARKLISNQTRIQGPRRPLPLKLSQLPPRSWEHFTFLTDSPSRKEQMPQGVKLQKFKRYEQLSLRELYYDDDPLAQVPIFLENKNASSRQYRSKTVSEAPPLDPFEAD